MKDFVNGLALFDISNHDLIIETTHGYIGNNISTHPDIDILIPPTL